MDWSVDGLKFRNLLLSSKKYGASLSTFIR